MAIECLTSHIFATKFAFFPVCFNHRFAVTLMAKVSLNLPSPLEGKVFHISSGLGSGRTPHRHAELEFNLILSGHATYVLQERRYDLRPDMLVWLFPEQTHVLADCSADFSMYVVVFRPDLVSAMVAAGAASVLGSAKPDGAYCRRLPEADAVRLAALCLALDAENRPALERNSGLRYLLLLAWQNFIEATDTVAGVELHPAIERCVQLLRRPQAPASLEDLAAAVALSSSRLSTLFNQQLGVSLSQFRNRIRLEKFFHLRQSRPALTLSEAALRAGFGTYSQFHRVFRDCMGSCPREFR